MIAVVGDGDSVGALVDAVRSVGGEAEVVVPADTPASDPSLVLAIGETAIIDLVDAGVDAPILPVDCPWGGNGVRADEAVAGADRLVAGEYVVRRHPLIAVTMGGSPLGGPAVSEAVLRTEEPARISEFSIHADGPLDRYRADGVVTATPIGSTGYARALGGPVLDPDTDGIAVVPIAAFALGTDHRVVPTGRDITVVVERDEAAVSLDLDGRTVGRVPAGEPVTIHVAESLETVVLRGDRTETL